MTALALVEILVEDQPDDLRAFLIDNQFSVAHVIAEHIAPEHNALFHSPALTPPDAFRGFAALLLSKRRHQSKSKLVVGLIGIYVVIHEYQSDTILAQLAGVGDAVEQVTGESRHLFRDNHIEFTVLAVLNHTVKVLALEGICAGDSLVHIDFRELPQRIPRDIFVKISLLTFERVRLVKLVGRHAAVGCHADHFSLFFHNSAPPLATQYILYFEKVQIFFRDGRICRPDYFIFA